MKILKCDDSSTSVEIQVLVGMLMYLRERGRELRLRICSRPAGFVHLIEGVQRQILNSACSSVFETAVITSALSQRGSSIDLSAVVKDMSVSLDRTITPWWK